MLRLNLVSVIDKAHVMFKSLICIHNQSTVLKCIPLGSVTPVCVLILISVVGLPASENEK